MRAPLLQALYTIRSERQLMEQLDYKILYRWFVGLVHSKLGGDDAAAAIRGIAGDADVHAFSKACLKHSLMTVAVCPLAVLRASRVAGATGLIAVRVPVCFKQALF